MDNEANPKKTYRLMALMALIMGALVALAIYSFSQVESPDSSTRLRRPTLTLNEPRDLPALAHQELGPHLSAESLQKKWTLLSFWSHTCPPCLVELPLLNQLALNWYGPEFSIVTINVDVESQDQRELAKQFIAQAEISLPTIYDEKGILRQAFGVSAYPTHVLIGPDQKIYWEALGAYRWDHPETREQLVKLLEPNHQEQRPDLQE